MITPDSGLRTVIEMKEFQGQFHTKRFTVSTETYLSQNNIFVVKFLFIYCYQISNPDHRFKSSFSTF